jgi:hypothetical protein
LRERSPGGITFVLILAKRRVPGAMDRDIYQHPRSVFFMAQLGEVAISISLSIEFDPLSTQLFAMVEMWRAH